VWNDDDATHRSIAAFAPDQVEGWVARNRLFDRMRDALRPDDDRDLWLDPDASRAEVERASPATTWRWRPCSPIPRSTTFGASSPTIA
jgi:hypothetical protein